MDPDTFPSQLSLVLALLATNAYFLIAKFSLLTPRRVPTASRDGDPRRAGLWERLQAPPEELLLVAQLGASTATLLMGFQLALMLGRDGTASQELVVTSGLAVAILSHALIGSYLPTLLGIYHSGPRFSHAVLLPLRLISLPLRPLAWPLARLVGAAGKLLGLAAPGFQPLVPTPEEIRNLVTRGHEHGVVEEEAREMIHGIFEFSETVAREVMTPRIDIVAVPVDIALDDLIRTVVTEGHSRLPVYEGTIDSVVGVLLAKDLLPLLAEPALASEPFDIRRVMREPYFVPDTKAVDDLLAEFRQQKVHLAIVLDEFGGTYGLVTMEDLLEEIVGEINDEYDIAEPEFAATPEGDVLIDGGALISEVNERFGLSLPEEDFDTIGGFVFGALGRVPVPGDEVGGLGRDEMVVLHVEETEDRRVIRVRLTRSARVEETVPDA